MRLFISHFTPLEHYPPIQNLLHFLEGEAKIDKVYCFTTKGRLSPINFNKKIVVYRLGILASNKILLWSTYILFNIFSFLYLVLRRPQKLLYFESLSVYPVFLYKKYINRKAEIYIHYHEYTTINEYQQASPIRRFFHSKEKYLYFNANWISHTNEVRLQKFLNDEGINFDSLIHHVMPNYPSKKWAKINSKWDKGQTLKLVYVGYSLTKEDSYLSEVVAFLKTSKIPIEVNTYCILPNDYLKSFEECGVNFTFKIHEPLLYEQLPEILSQHHIGLILYKSVKENVIHCAPNKLFEYLSCGLDVWYPEEMQGIHSYDTNGRPKVLRLDFKKLEQLKFYDLLESKSENDNMAFFAEDIYSVLEKSIKEQD